MEIVLIQTGESRRRKASRSGGYLYSTFR